MTYRDLKHVLPDAVLISWTESNGQGHLEKVSLPLAQFLINSGAPVTLAHSQSSWPQVRVTDESRVIAMSREEWDSCQRGTAGCCIDHRHDTKDECATW